ncbi:SLC13 family permease [Dermacoccus barathri]
MTIAGDDGTRRQVYRMRCRWLPWEPGTPRVAELLLGFFGKSDTRSLGGLSGDAGAVVLVVLLVPLVVAASLVMGELALLLLTLPLLALRRVLLRRPWPVYVARNGGVIHVERASTFTAARKRRNEIHFLAADAAEPLSSASSGQLALAALAGIAVVVLGITAAKLHPFLALILGSAALALVAWVPGEAAVKSFTTGFGTTVGSVGLLVALGAMVGQLLADSGGGNAIVDKLVFGVKAAALPWVMALVAAIIGLPMFFEIGVVLLIPVVLSVARRAKQPVLLVGIPALAGLSVLHALVPPHPGPVAAIEAVKADTGRTLMFGVLLAIPTLIIAGPLLARLIARLVPVDAPAELAADAGSTGAAVGDSDLAEESADGKAASPATKRPSFGAAIGCILLAVCSCCSHRSRRSSCPTRARSSPS